MAVDMNVRFDKSLITQLSKNKGEPDWMLELRLKSLGLYKESPLPKVEKIKIDNWNIDNFDFTIDEQQQLEKAEQLPAFMQSVIASNIKERSVLVQKDSSVIYQDVSRNLKKQGVIYTDLMDALQNYPDLVKKYFMKDIKLDDKLITLHTALWNGGVFLYIPKNVVVDFPVQSLFLAEKTGLLPHILIVAEENSSVTYVDHYFSSDTTISPIHNGVSEVYVGENARVRYATIHNFNKNVYDYTYRKALVERNGSIEWVIGEMNDGNTLSANTSILKDSGANVDTKSIFIGTGNQKTNFVSKVIHVGDHTNSSILSHGVMLDKSTGIFDGITQIEKGAVKANAKQAEKILMLSEEARGDANPILLIEEHDVVAGHAASAGPVNKEDIYYLMSRGIKKEEAERLIIHGFLSPVVSRIPIEGLQEQLENVIERKLSK